jgi:hypothetical protein
VKKYLFLCGLILWCGSLLAQSNFRRGYVVLASGDTLRGQVDLRGAQRNARISRFRSVGTTTVTEYQPPQLRGYGALGSQVYQSAVVTLVDSLARQSLLTNTVRDSIRLPVFLEVLVQGPASLLYLRDSKNNDHYYLQLRAGLLQELIQATQQTEVKGHIYQQKTTHYRRTLANAMQSCLAVQATISNLPYFESDMIRLVQQYNSCVGGVSVAPASASREKNVRLGVLLGGESSQLIFYGDYVPSNREQATPAPVVGVSLTAKLGALNPKLAVRIEALYEQQSFTYKRDRVLANGLLNPQQGEVDLASIRVPLLVRYTLPKGGVRPFLQVGYSASYLLRTHNRFRTENVYANPRTYTRWAPYIYEPKELEQGIVGSVGVTTAKANARNLALELRYERSDGFSNNIYLGTKLNRYYLLLSYDLTK